MRRLDEAAGMLGTVLAPAGFGKTTLLAQWANAARPGTVAWLSLDESEEEPSVFWAHVSAALGGSPDRTEATLADAIDLAERASAETLVLDGLERIAGSPAADELWRFVSEWPSLQIVVSGRVEPSLPLAAVRARGELLELRAPDLRFDSREVQEIVDRAGGTDGALADACAGWPAALRLALAATSVRVWEEQLLAFVREEVLADDPDAQQFLLRTALLEELSAEQCDMLLESRPMTRPSAEILAELEARHLLVERHREGRYRLEPAARRVLRSDLERSEPRVAAELHLRAARVARASGHMEGAVEHLLAAGDSIAAGRLVAATWERATDEGRQAQVLDWLERLPAGAGNLHLALARGWLLRLDGRRAESERWLDLAQASAPPKLRAPAARACLLARAVLPWDDAGQAMTLARRAWRTERRGPRRALAAWALGWASWWSGDFEASRTFLADALVGGPRLVEIAALAVLARLDLDAGDVDAAEIRVVVAQRLIGERCLEGLPELGMVATAAGAVAAARGHWSDALDGVERGVRLRRRWGHPLEAVDALAVAAPVVARERGRRAAGALLAEARLLLDACADPGVLTERLAASTRVALPRPAAGGNDELTPRERAVLQLLAEGYSKREIAERLFVSFNTVHSHTKAVYRKLGVSSRREAVERASEITLR
jgi:LuxR family maltose regulon positive regulatory protein